MCLTYFPCVQRVRGNSNVIAIAGYHPRDTPAGTPPGTPGTPLQEHLPGAPAGVLPPVGAVGAGVQGYPPTTCTTPVPPLPTPGTPPPCQWFRVVTPSSAAAVQVSQGAAGGRFLHVPVPVRLTSYNSSWRLLLARQVYPKLTSATRVQVLAFPTYSCPRMFPYCCPD